MQLSTHRQEFAASSSRGHNYMWHADFASRRNRGTKSANAVNAAIRRASRRLEAPPQDEPNSGRRAGKGRATLAYRRRATSAAPGCRHTGDQRQDDVGVANDGRPRDHHRRDRRREARSFAATAKRRCTAATRVVKGQSSPPCSSLRDELPREIENPLHRYLTAISRLRLGILTERGVGSSLVVGLP